MKNTRGPSNNAYHFKLHKYDIDNNLINIKYYKTAKEICNEYICCRNTIYEYLKHPEKPHYKLGNIKLERIHEPMHILVKNPRIVEIQQNISIDNLEQITEN